MLIRVDDAVARLRGYWLGPDKSIRWWWDWTYPEWAVCGAVTFAVWIVLGIGGWFLWGAIGAQEFEQLALTLVIALPTGPVAGWTAQRQVAPILNSDRRFTWLWIGWVAAAKQLWWAHGPIDRVAAGFAAGLWLFLSPFTMALPGVAVIWMGILAFVSTRTVCWVRDRVEPGARYWARAEARLTRAAGLPTQPFEVPISLTVRDGATARPRRMALTDRRQALVDIARHRFRKVPV